MWLCAVVVVVVVVVVVDRHVDTGYVLSPGLYVVSITGQLFFVIPQPILLT